MKARLNSKFYKIKVKQSLRSREQNKNKTLFYLIKARGVLI